MTKTVHLVLILLAGLLLVGCVGVDGEPLALQSDATVNPQTKSTAASAAPGPAAKPEESNLLAALDYIPAGLDEVYFTDWAAVHRTMGLDRARDTITEEWMMAVNKDHVVTTMYGGYHLREHEDVWGWDPLDLEWEVLLSGGGLPPIYMLKFYDGFDFAPIIDHFETRGFMRQEHDGVPVYSHELDVSQEWVRTTELAIHNVALLEEEKLMILSSAPEIVPAMLQVLSDGESTISGILDPAAKAVAQRLAGAATALILPRPDVCLSFSPNPLHGAIGKTDVDPAELLEESMPAKPQAIYTALGLGHYYPVTGEVGTDETTGDAVDDAPAGAPGDLLGDAYWLVVLHYESPALAKIDLTPRLTLAEQGMSQVADVPYTDMFSVKAATTDGSDIVLALAPAPDRPQSVLLNMLIQRDMLFAACP